MTTLTDGCGPFGITPYGAVGDGATDCTEAFAQAIAAAAAAGGGMVRVPPGDYLTGPIHLRSRVELRVEAGAVVRFKDDFEAFPIVQTRWAGFVCHGLSPCLYADHCQDVAITGGGVFDGQGMAWWREFWRLYESRRGPQFPFEHELKKLNAGVETGGTVWDEWPPQFLRPPLLQFHHCERVTLEGVTLRNSPFWNTHVVFCNDVRVSGVRFENPGPLDEPKAANADGLDIDSSTNVRVSDCIFNVKDDCVCLKAGINADGVRVGRPTENVTITNCVMGRGHGGIVFGSDTAGWIRRVTVSNCVFNGTRRGIRLKSRRGRGGGVEDVRISNIVMDRVPVPIVLNLYYSAGTTEESRRYEADRAAHPVTELTPRFRRIDIAHVSATAVDLAAGVLVGLPESPLEDVTLTDFRVDVDPAPDAVPNKPAIVFHHGVMLGRGFIIEHCRRLSMSQGSVRLREGAPFQISDCDDVRLTNVATSSGDADAPRIVSHNVTGLVDWH